MFLRVFHSFIFYLLCVCLSNLQQQVGVNPNQSAKEQVIFTKSGTWITESALRGMFSKKKDLRSGSSLRSQALQFHVFTIEVSVPLHQGEDEKIS